MKTRHYLTMLIGYLKAKAMNNNFILRFSLLGFRCFRAIKMRLGWRDSILLPFYFPKIKILHIGQVHSPHFATLNKYIKSRFFDIGIRQYGYLVCCYPTICQNNEEYDKIYDYANYGYFHTVSYQHWEDDLLFKANNSLNHVAHKVSSLVNKWKPDLVWIHDIQAGGYIYLDAENDFKYHPPVIATTYGNDLYFFRYHNTHNIRISKLLKEVSLLHVETLRDRMLAQEMGYSNSYAPICSATFKTYNATNHVLVNSNNRDIFILIKGSYRLRSDLPAFFRFIEANPNIWQGRSLVVFNSTSDDEFMCEGIRNRFNLNITCTKRLRSSDLMNLMSRSHYHLSVTLSDGVANTCVEAIMHGCIPLITEHNGFIELIPDRFKNMLCIKLPFTDAFLDQLTSIDNDDSLKNEILKEIQEKIYHYFSTATLDNFFKQILTLHDPVSKSHSLQS